MRRLLKRLPLAVSAILLIGLAVSGSGCTIKSGPKEFAKPEAPKTQPAPTAAARLAKAFAVTGREGKKFMFSGWAITKIQKRNTGYYFSGGYDRDKGYNLEGPRIMGLPFRYYRWGKDVYISEEDKWRKIEPAETPLEPFAGFTRLQLPYDKAVQLPDEDILGNKCSVYRLTLDSTDAVKAARSVGVQVSDDKASPSRPYLDRMKMVFTIWVGQADSFIYQYRTETTMPVPDAGTMYQEVFFKFWDYNKPSVKLQDPKKLERYLVKEQAG